MKESILRLLDRITDAFVALDEDWRFAYINTRAAEILARERLDLLGKVIWDELPALVHEPFYTACLDAMEQQSPTQIERYSSRLGRWIENRIYPSAEGLTILFTDITDRKAQEARLQQYHDIFRLAEIGLVIGTGDGTTLDLLNPAFARMHGYEVEELRGRPVQDVYAPEARGKLPSLIRHTEEIGHHVYESLHLHRNGTTFPVSVDTTAVRDESNRVLYRIVNVTDISKRKQTENAIQENVVRLGALIGNIHSGILVEDSKNHIVLTNQALCDMMGMGVPPDALVGARMLLFAERVRALFTAPDILLARLAAIHRGQRAVQGEEMRLADGRVFELDYAPVLPESGGSYHLWQMRDMTDRRRIEQELREKSTVLKAQKQELETQKQELESQKRELEALNMRLAELATRDGLTGLLNYRAFQERLAEEVEIAVRQDTSLSLILLDVDRFKELNDASGHLAGDVVLRTVAHILQGCTRDTDWIARYGGEEFAIILAATDLDRAAVFANQVRAELEGYPWPVRSVTASFGVACLMRGDESGVDLVARADGAMYRSKAAGRNQVTCGPLLIEG